MKLIAIANISNGEKTIGFRLLDTETKQVKNVPIYNITGALKANTIQIDNLILKDRAVSGYNGSIDRLPKIVEGKLVGKSPLIILNTLGNIGYTVSDYKGTIVNVKEADLIKYAKNNGISNGKIVSKDSREFISSIEGGYEVVSLDNLSNKNEQYYTGEAIIGAKALDPIIMAEHGSYSYQTSTKMLYMDGDRVGTRYIGTPNAITMEKITKNMVYKYGEYTLFNCVTKEIDIRNRKELIKLMQMESFRKGIDQSISNMYSSSGRISAKTGLAVPTQDNKYSSICIDIQVGDKNIVYDNLTEEKIQSYIDKLRVMKAKCYIQYMIPFSEKMALKRKCSEAGVSYEIVAVTQNFKSQNRDMTVEEIYYYNKEFNNVIVTDTELKIISLDGVYKYDMDKIHKTYNREIMKSNKNAKAMVMGHSHTEDISIAGELKKIKTSLKALVIPSTVRIIEDGSIILSHENTDIIFGSGIEKCGTRAITKGTGGIGYIEIGSNNDRDNILNSIYSIKYILTNCIIHFIDDITPEEYVEVLYNTRNCKNITANNAECINDAFIVKVIAQTTATKLDNLNILKAKIIINKNKGKNNNITTYSYDIDYSLSEFKRYYEVLREAWLGGLGTKASDELRTKGNKLFRDIDNKLEFREKEAEDTKSKLIAQEESRYRERQERKQLRKNNSW